MELITALIAALGGTAGIVAIIKAIKQPAVQNDNTTALICLLRNSITHIYYRYEPSNTIPSWELENVLHLYEAYKTLGGNSYVEELIGQIKEFKIEA